jgi:hypothetical protein
MRENHLRKFFPELVKELQASGELKDYLVATTYAVHELADLLERQGADAQAVRELAMLELLPPGAGGRGQSRTLGSGRLHRLADGRSRASPHRKKHLNHLPQQ